MEQPNTIQDKDEWDVQMDHDATAGKLDFLRDEAKGGSCCPVCYPNPTANSMPVEDLCPKHLQEYEIIAAYLKNEKDL